jgi:hypothetical protein
MHIQNTEEKKKKKKKKKKKNISKKMYEPNGSKYKSVQNIKKALKNQGKSYSEMFLEVGVFCEPKQGNIANKYMKLLIYKI